jgi:hypothetical protein
VEKPGQGEVLILLVLVLGFLPKTCEDENEEETENSSAT